MDDLAKEMSISKKTIYQHYKDKRALVKEAFDHDLAMDKAACFETCAKTENAIQQFLNISLWVNNNLKGMNPTVLFDLQKYYPECWKSFDNFTREVIYKFMLNNLNSGIEQGYYRSDLHSEFVTTVYISMVKQLVQSEYKQIDLSIAEIHHHAISYHLAAICTPKGKEYLNQHLIQ
jgi:AcrR family transcriptional regulator